jgi:hypothetical protein
MALRNTSKTWSWMLIALACVLAGAASRDASGAERKWPTDETLRSGMAAIRKATLDNHTLVTHRRMPPAGARAFAEKVSAEISRINASARVPADARQALGDLLADIAEGGEAVAGVVEGMSPIDGIVQIDAALGRYPEQFDDPTWQPLR